MTLTPLTKNTGLRAVLFCLALAAPSSAITAQEIPRDEYINHLPIGLPKLVQQNDATVALSVYGDASDPTYRDVNPVDGIDDSRHASLMALSVRFAPFLIQNTGDLPTNFQTYIDNRSSFPLTRDTWDRTGHDIHIVESSGTDFALLGQAACDPALRGDALATYPEPTTDPAIEDCKVLELMDLFTPGTGAVRSRDDGLIVSRPNELDVLFFNFPGDGSRNWKQAYAPEYDATPPERRASFPHAFVHPFLLEAVDGSGYEFLLQYWFFYPTNDSGMDHEGDWEHINVVVSPRSMVEGNLDAATVGSILDSSISVGGDISDPLVIKRVDYYFHHFIMPLDFSSPNAYLPREEWEAAVDARPQEKFREAEIWEKIRYMVYEDDEETVINTHTFGYIGADNKGLNQALESPGGSNRDPHGTYPFPGRYSNVGPGGTTDQVAQHVDSRAYLRALHDGTETIGPVFEGGSVLGLADPERLRIVPDWERVADLARADFEVRADWAWLLLPIRWGYPATVSPFSGILQNFNTGNVAPQGPSLNAGWNTSGQSAGFTLFEPHTIASVFPLQVQDGFRNDLGYLNLTLPLLLNAPPLDVITRLVAYPFRLLLGRQDPVYYPADGVPFRFVGISSGLSIQIMDGDFAALALNGQQTEEFVQRVIDHVATNGDETTEVVAGTSFKTNAIGSFVQIPFYIGGKFTTENTFRNVRSSFGFSADYNNIPSYTYSADLNFWEYIGSLRYSFTSSRVQPFIKGGYSWSWGRVENAIANGDPFTPATTDWRGPDRIWPRVWHYGLGVEYVPWKRVGVLPEGIEVAFRVEYVQFKHSLDASLNDILLTEIAQIYSTVGDLPGTSNVTRHDFVFGISVTF